MTISVIFAIKNGVMMLLAINGGDAMTIGDVGVELLCDEFKNFIKPSSCGLFKIYNNCGFVAFFTKDDDFEKVFRMCYVAANMRKCFMPLNLGQRVYVVDDYLYFNRIVTKNGAMPFKIKIDRLYTQLALRTQR